MGPLGAHGECLLAVQGAFSATLWLQTGGAYAVSCAGDSACSIPTQTLPADVLATMREWTLAIAKELKVVGLINIQFAVQDNVPYIIEANPRASR